MNKGTRRLRRLSQATFLGLSRGEIAHKAVIDDFIAFDLALLRQLFRQAGPKDITRRRGGPW